MSDKRKTKKVRLSVCLERSEREALDRLARKQNITIANYVRQMLGWPEESRGILRVGPREKLMRPTTVLTAVGERPVAEKAG